MFNAYFNSEQDLSYQVLDVTGRVVVRKDNVRAGQFEIDLSDQPNGIYILNVVSGEESLMERLIKQ